MARLHPDALICQLTHAEIIRLFQICQHQLIGHYIGSLQKVIYKKKFTPEGRPIEYLERKNRKVWYCPADQHPR